MVIINRQNSNAIREHLNELHRGLKNSKNKKVLNDFIDFWSIEYIIQKNKELNINK